MFKEITKLFDDEIEQMEGALVPDWKNIERITRLYKAIETIFTKQPIYKITEELNKGSVVNPAWKEQQPWFYDQSPINSSPSHGLGIMQKNHRSRLKIELATPQELYAEIVSYESFLADQGAAEHDAMTERKEAEAAQLWINEE